MANNFIRSYRFIVGMVGEISAGLTKSIKRWKAILAFAAMFGFFWNYTGAWVQGILLQPLSQSRAKAWLLSEPDFTALADLWHYGNLDFAAMIRAIGVALTGSILLNFLFNAYTVFSLRFDKQTTQELEKTFSVKHTAALAAIQAICLFVSLALLFVAAYPLAFNLTKWLENHRTEIFSTVVLGLFLLFIILVFLMNLIGNNLSKIIYVNSRLGVGQSIAKGFALTLKKIHWLLPFGLIWVLLLSQIQRTYAPMVACGESIRVASELPAAVFLMVSFFVLLCMKYFMLSLLCSLAKADIQKY